MKKGSNRADKKKIGFSQKAFVFNRNGKFLTMRRTHTAPSGPLSWDLPGGVVDYGEKPVAAIRREIKEETGLAVKNLIPFDVEAHTSKNGEYWITVLYAAEASSGKFSVSWEHDLHKWVTKTEFLKMKIKAGFRSAAKRLP